MICQVCHLQCHLGILQIAEVLHELFINVSIHCLNDSLERDCAGVTACGWRKDRNVNDGVERTCS